MKKLLAKELLWCREDKKIRKGVEYKYVDQKYLTEDQIKSSSSLGIFSFVLSSTVVDLILRFYPERRIFFLTDENNDEEKFDVEFFIYPKVYKKEMKELSNFITKQSKYLFSEMVSFNVDNTLTDSENTSYVDLISKISSNVTNKNDNSWFNHLKTKMEEQEGNLTFNYFLSVDSTFSFLINGATVNDREKITEWLELNHLPPDEEGSIVLTEELYNKYTEISESIRNRITELSETKFAKVLEDISKEVPKL